MRENDAGSKAVTDNRYAQVTRITDQAYRDRLTSWQLPAIRTHFGDLTGQAFLDIGAGDIVLGEHLAELGPPAVFYAQDLNRKSLDAGMARLARAGSPTERIVTLASPDFDFSAIPDGGLDAAFSNSLFSHLSINSIVLCLRRLAPKLKAGGKYLSSMIVLPHDEEDQPFDWSHLGLKGTNVVSYPACDPYHYSPDTVLHLSTFQTGFEVVKIHPYGHPFQKLVEFRRRGL